jgi:hypothetical protein
MNLLPIEFERLFGGSVYTRSSKVRIVASSCVNRRDSVTYKMCPLLNGSRPAIAEIHVADAGQRPSDSRLCTRIEVEQNVCKPQPKAKISSSIQRGVISRVESFKVSEPVDAKLQLSPGNLVSWKHDDLLGMSTDDAVMEFPYHLPTTSD